MDIKREWLLQSFRLLITIILVVTTSSTWALPRVDYDVDDDGLIEIQDLEDLNEIRNNFEIVNGGDEANEIRGYSLYGSSDGCSVELDGCWGYELINDLNFDTNENGEFDEGDTYWNEGKGWNPIGNFGLKFNTEFKGNGHTVYNLTMRRPGERFLGLFGYAELAHIHGFSLTANLVTGGDSGSVIGYSWNTFLENIQLETTILANQADDDCTVHCDPDYVGGLVGIAELTTFNHIVVNAKVSGRNGLGGLAGTIADSRLNEIAVNAEVSGDDLIGGMAGNVSSANIRSVVAITRLKGDSAVGGLIGNASGTNIKNIFLSGTLTAGMGASAYPRGGSLMGYVNHDDIANVVSLVRLQESKDELYIGALVGEAGIPTIENAYFAQDLALRNELYFTGGTGNPTQYLDLVDLQCASDTKDCNGLIFTTFGEEKNSLNDNLWAFGTNTQAPTMILSIGEFSDKDGDGEADNWPTIQEDSLNLPPIEPSPNPVIPDENESSSSSGSLYYLLLLMPLLWRRRYSI